GRVTDLAVARGLKLIRVRPRPADPVASSGAAETAGEAGDGTDSGSPSSAQPGVMDRIAAEVGRELGNEVRSTFRRNSLIARGESATSRTRSNLDQLRRALPPPVEKPASSEPATSDSGDPKGTGSDLTAQDGVAKEGDS